MWISESLRLHAAKLMVSGSALIFVFSRYNYILNLGVPHLGGSMVTMLDLGYIFVLPCAISQYQLQVSLQVYNPRSKFARYFRVKCTLLSQSIKWFLFYPPNNNFSTLHHQLHKFLQSFPTSNVRLQMNGNCQFRPPYVDPTRIYRQSILVLKISNFN